MNLFIGISTLHASVAPGRKSTKSNLRVKNSLRKKKQPASTKSNSKKQTFAEKLKYYIEAFLRIIVNFFRNPVPKLKELHRRLWLFLRIIVDFFRNPVPKLNALKRKLKILHVKTKITLGEFVKTAPAKTKQWAKKTKELAQISWEKTKKTKDYLLENRRALWVKNKKTLLIYTLLFLFFIITFLGLTMRIKRVVIQITYNDNIKPDYILVTMLFWSFSSYETDRNKAIKKAEKFGLKPSEDGKTWSLLENDTSTNRYNIIKPPKFYYIKSHFKINGAHTNCDYITSCEKSECDNGEVDGNRGYYLLHFQGKTINDMEDLA